MSFNILPMMENNSRFINIKYLNDDKFIFLSITKVLGNDIETNNKASLVFLNTVNIQIIIQGSVFKIDESSSDEHWAYKIQRKNNLLFHHTNLHLLHHMMRLLKTLKFV